jgi:hypothetical protein
VSDTDSGKIKLDFAVKETAFTNKKRGEKPTARFVGIHNESSG